MLSARPRAVAALVLLLATLLAGCSAMAGSHPAAAGPGSRSSAVTDRTSAVTARSAASTRSAASATRTRSAPAAPVRKPDYTLPRGSCRAGACSHSAIHVWTRVPFTPPVACARDGSRCRLTMDVFAPAGGGPWPVVVLEPGGPEPPSAYRSLDRAAFPIAAGGAVVMVASWRQRADFGGGFPTSFHDVACAVGVARRTAASYGGRGDRVVLAGHSLGGWAAAVVTLSRTTFRPAAGECQATKGSLRPDALVSMSGAAYEVHDSGDESYLESFFGGPRTSRSAAWQEADAVADLSDPRVGSHSAPVTVVGGGADRVVPQSIAVAFNARLRAAGYRTNLVLVPSADHTGIVTAKPTTQAILRVAATLDGRGAGG